MLKFNEFPISDILATYKPLVSSIKTRIMFNILQLLQHSLNAVA